MDRRAIRGSGNRPPLLGLYGSVRRLYQNNGIQVNPLFGRHPQVPPTLCKAAPADGGTRPLGVLAPAEAGAPIAAIELAPSKGSDLYQRAAGQTAFSTANFPPASPFGGNAGGSRSGGLVLRDLKGRWVRSCPRRMDLRYLARATPPALVGGGSREY